MRDIVFGFNAAVVPNGVLIQNEGVQIAYSSEPFDEVTHSDIAGLSFTTDFLIVPFDAVAVILTPPGNFFKIGPWVENVPNISFRWEQLIP